MLFAIFRTAVGVVLAMLVAWVFDEFRMVTTLPAVIAFAAFMFLSIRHAQQGRRI